MDLFEFALLKIGSIIGLDSNPYVNRYIRKLVLLLILEIINYTFINNFLLFKTNFAPVRAGYMAHGKKSSFHR